MHPTLQSHVSLIGKSLTSSFQLWIKLMLMIIPINLTVKICEEIGLISVFGDLLKPVMVMVGLPGIIGLVWAVTLMTNLWAGALLFVSLAAVETLTTAQVTVLGIMMLMAHGLPLELRMVQKCGVSLMFALVLRVVSALGLAYLFNLAFMSLDLLQTPAEILLDVSSGDNHSWANWLVDQLKSYGLVLSMLMVLVLFLDYLKHYGLVYRLGRLFATYLSLIGVSRQCAPITLVGMTLGLVYGGALLIREVETGEMHEDEISISVVSMNLFHSIIEDTIIVVLMGAALFWVLVVRFAFTVIVMKTLSIALEKNRDLVFGMIRNSKPELIPEIRTD